MPVTLEDPFQLASFSSTTHHHQHPQAVSCSPEKEARSTDDSENNLLVVAVQGEGVQLFNTADQKCILSYSSPPGYSFAGSAQTLHKATHRNVYAVVAKGTDIPTKEEGKVIWMWRDETSSDKDAEISEDAAVKPSTARKNVQKFDRKIHQLFVSSLLPNHVVLTNTDGSLSLVTEDLKRVVNTKDHPTPAPKSKKDKNSKPVIVNTTWATTFNTTGSWIPASALARNTLIILTITESSAEKITVTFSYVNEEHRGFSTFGHIDIVTGSGALGFAFDVKSGQFSFMTAGQLKVYQFAVSQGDHIISATESLTLPLPGYVLSSTATPSKKGAKATSETDARIQHTDSIALGDNYLAVAGNHKTGDKSELTLTVWDIKYGTLQAKHTIPGNFSAQDTTCSLTVLPDSVLVLTISALAGTSIKSDIYLCPFYSEPMSLLGAMGRMKDTAPFIGLQGPALSQDAYTSTTTALLAPSNVGGTVKASALAATHLNKQVDLAQKIEQETLKKLSSESATPTVAAFEKVFFANIERLSQEAIDDMMARYGVDQEKARNVANNVEESKPEAMEVDSVPVKTAEDELLKKKNKKKAAKAAAKAAAAAKEAEKAKEPVDGSSSESSSDEDDDGDEEEVIMLSSDEENDEADGDKDMEDDEYKQREEQERASLEAHMEKMKGWLKTEEEAIKNQKLHRREQRVARKATPRPELSHHFLTTVVGRCFRRLPNGQPDMTFWPEMVVRYLIFNQLVGNSNPGAGQSGIALELMEREQWSLIELALQKLHDIPELDMITMLKQVIGLNKNKHNSTSSETTTSTSHSTSTSSLPGSTSSSTSTSSSSVPDIPHFLHLIMAAPRNEVFMQQAVKRLNVEELSIVLEILKDWICNWSELGGIGHSKHGSVKLPNYSLMVDFTTVLMDVHFPSLIMSPHLHPVLKAIQGSIQKETEVSNQLEQTLRGPLGLFDRKHKDMVRRKKAARLNGSVPAGGLMAEKKKKREGDTVASDYVVEIIHL
ncbi:hypothetical protein BG000_004886 [Podila horticola]|nr:hypothetical protein BG000_004886 [Podila horticola]